MTHSIIGVSLLLVLAMPTESPGILAMATIGKFGAVCAFAIIYVQAAEIFPTVIRYVINPITLPWKVEGALL